MKYFVLLVQHIALQYASRQRNIQDTLMKMKKTLHAPVVFYFRPTLTPQKNVLFFSCGDAKEKDAAAPK